MALGAMALVVAASVAWYAVQPRAEAAPGFSLSAIPDGKGRGNSTSTLDLGAAHGKVVVLDLMAVNCAACRTLTKDVLKPLWEEQRNGTGVVLWSIDVWAGLPGQVGESADDLARVRDEGGASWPHGLDDGSVYSAYRPLALPQLMVLDGDGRVIFSQSAPDLPSLSSVEGAVSAAKTRGSAAVGIPQAGLAALAVGAGAVAVLSPCSIGLLPAYFGLLLRGKGGRPVLGGLQTTAGVVLVYAAIAAALLPFGSALLPLVPKLGIAMGLLFVVLGALMLSKFDWGRLTRRVRRDRLVPDGSNRGYWAFGVGYALASFGCTGPIFLPLLFSSFAAGPLVGAGVFLLYAAGVAVLLVLIALLASLGADGPLRWLTSKGAWVTRVVAVAWIGAGAYLVWYDLRAFA